MVENALNNFFGMVWQTWQGVGFKISPATVSITIFTILLPFILIVIFAITQREESLPPPAGCKRLGLVGLSILSDQYAKQYSRGADASASNRWKVKAIFIYPLESCAGIELESASIVRSGLKYDHQFALGQQVTGLPSLQGKVESSWKCVNQQTFPRLAKVETEIWIPDHQALGFTENAEYVKSEGCLIVRFPFSPDTDFSIEGLRAYGKILAAKLQGKSEPTLEFRVPLNPPKDHIREMKYKYEKIDIENDCPEALDIGTDIPDDMMAKLAYTLGVANPLSLFRIDTAGHREMPKRAPQAADLAVQSGIGTQDLHPIRLINLATVHHIGSKLSRKLAYTERLNALRYHANIYIVGPPSFAEDSWTKVRIGELECHVSWKTTQQELPNMDQETDIVNMNKRGASMARHRLVGLGSKSACLELRVTPNAEGALRVGDRAEVLDTMEQSSLEV